MMAIAGLACVAACADRTPATAPPPTDGAATASLASISKRPEALAKIVAKGLKNAAFRAYLKAQLDASPYHEHKLQLQTFLAANSGRALREIAGENGITQESIVAQAKAAIELEVYIPVPAHRAAWTGNENILVATALTDDDPPIAFVHTSNDVHHSPIPVIRVGREVSKKCERVTRLDARSRLTRDVNAYGVCAGGVRGGTTAWPSVLLSVPNQIDLVAGS
jgi:hypothetical protein